MSKEKPQRKLSTDSQIRQIKPVENKEIVKLKWTFFYKHHQATKPDHNYNKTIATATSLKATTPEQLAIHQSAQPSQIRNASNDAELEVDRLPVDLFDDPSFIQYM